MKAAVLTVLILGTVNRLVYSCEDHLDPALLASRELISNRSCAGAMTPGDVTHNTVAVGTRLDVLLNGLAARLDSNERERLLSAQSHWFTDRGDYCLWFTSSVAVASFHPLLTEWCESSLAASRVEELCGQYCQGSEVAAQCRGSCFCRDPGE